ncbi:hypothetical protein [Leptospira stimsonii]|nr:hypothetical protein [Leptospira stimsonii]
MPGPFLMGKKMWDGKESRETEILFASFLKKKPTLKEGIRILLKEDK